jgi:hypothetical protein
MGSESWEDPAGQLELKLVERGRARGWSTFVVQLLELRGIEIPDSDRKRILDCTDTEQLRLWFRRAYSASDVGTIFD